MLTKALLVLLTAAATLAPAAAFAATAQVNSVVNITDHNGNSMMTIPESQEHSGSGAGASTYITEIIASSAGTSSANTVLAFFNANDFNTGTGSSPSIFKVPSTSTFQVDYACEVTGNGAGFWGLGVTPSAFTDQAGTTLPTNSTCYGKQGTACGFFIPSAGGNTSKCWPRHFKIGPNMSPFAQMSVGASNNAVVLILGGVLK